MRIPFNRRNPKSYENLKIIFIRDTDSNVSIRTNCLMDKGLLKYDAGDDLTQARYIYTATYRNARKLSL